MTTYTTGLDHLDDRADTATTPQEVDAFAERYAAQTADRLPPSSLHVPPARPHRHQLLSPSDVVPLVGRPGWHSMGTPEQVSEEWEAVEVGREALEQSTADVRALDGDQHQEGARYAAAVEEAVTAGQSVPAPVRTDWEAERVRRETTDRVRQQQLRAARRRYDELVEEALPAWRERVAEEVERRREEARQALASAEGPVSDFVSAAVALDSMTERPDFEPRDYVEQAKAQIDPRMHASYAHIKAAQLAQEAREAYEEDRRRVGRARHALDLIREALA